MQKNLRIDYQLSYTPYRAALILLLAIGTCLLFLDIPRILLFVFWVLASVLILWNLSRLYRGACVLDFDGENWHIHEKDHSVIVDLLPESFVSSYFLLLVFKTKTENKWFRYYFSRDNSSEAEFRALCRLSIRS